VPVTFLATPGRLDVVATAALGVPRADVQRAIAAGRILVDGAVRPKSFRLLGGEVIDSSFEDHVAPEPEAGPLPILLQDDDLIIVSKPAGLVTHPTASRRTGTLVNRLMALGIPLSTLGGPDRPGIVHRLDAGTSGLMVVAKNDATHEALADLFRRHDVDRRYLALVRGAAEHDEFLIDAPLERRGARIVARASGGKEASTLVRVRERFERAALVEVRPRTGRTHQIRVHLSAAGLPILGDRAYGGGGDDAGRLALTRPFLHSWFIAFAHPSTGRPVELEDPLPEDLAEALRRVREANGAGGPAGAPGGRRSGPR
jgi:23S rRNA pseudouridine1911/1915/1917 synthase